ncbi:MAG: DUF1194 domain-containing protein [Alphaproteobacteria bacterium]|nr:DUF1194 domain-containing protein [Alphaproteobacteria bacterium]
MTWVAVLLALAGLPARAADADLALVMAIDVSGSIDPGEYRLQHEGIARALENPAVLSAIAGGPHAAIDATVMEWSDRDKQVVIVPWMRISDKASGAAFAAKVRAAHRTSNGLTAIGDALLAAAATFKTLPDHPTRRVIDLSGDGMANIGPKPADVRDALVAQGISVNGLAILQNEPWLSTYYDQNVIGGQGSFLLDVQNYDTFAQAMQEKLINEIAALPAHRKRIGRARGPAESASISNLTQMQ